MPIGVKYPELERQVGSAQLCWEFSIFNYQLPMNRNKNTKEMKTIKLLNP
jgi:hypothetical protein